MHPLHDHQASITRRQLFGRGALGIGGAALGTLLHDDAVAAGGQPGSPHFAAKAKRVIYLFMNGAPTHVDLFDYKPKLKELHGQPIPQDYVAGKRFSTMTSGAKKVFMPEITKFSQHGKSGRWIAGRCLPGLQRDRNESRPPASDGCAAELVRRRARRPRDGPGGC